MRFKLKLTTEKKNNNLLLPINYQYGLSSFIYRTFNHGNKDLAGWLHNRGFIVENKAFKLFTFSPLKIKNFKRYDDRLIVLDDQVELMISFYPFELTESFIFGAFSHQNFRLGDKKSSVQFNIQQIERLPDPAFKDTMEFKAISPVVVTAKKDRESKYVTYLSPGDQGYGNKLKENLLNKYAAYCSYHEKELDIEDMSKYKYELITDKPKSKLITIKAGTREESKIRGFLYTLRLTAPLPLLKTAYYAGLGEKNSLGMGCLEVR
jgi:CRISPR-associated endoribonuclease Cas6